MASLKRELESKAGSSLVDFHDRKVMASLKRDGWGDTWQVTTNFHDRKVMASLKRSDRFDSLAEA